MSGTAESAPARQRILESARATFADQGFGSTSIKDVAKRAGVSQGLMYTYFESKDALLRAIFEEGFQDIISTLPEDEPGEALAALEGVLRSSFELVRRHEPLWRLLYALRTQPSVTERLGLDLHDWTEVVEARLRQLCERAGLARPEVEAKLLIAVIDGANQHNLASREPYPVEEVIGALLEKYRR